MQISQMAYNLSISVPSESTKGTGKFVHNRILSVCNATYTTTRFLSELVLARSLVKDTLEARGHCKFQLKKLKRLFQLGRVKSRSFLHQVYIGDSSRSLLAV